ncbi:MAG: hypothetical protein FJ363_06735 [Gemmatimonadetes bacterium]|nr:hypothetical protein [Gemmatimonadota bacterium]
MTGPGPGSEPRTGERSREPRSGARPSEPRPDGRRRARVTEARAPERADVPWSTANAGLIRWATWIALAVIAIRLIAPRPDGWRRWGDAAAALNDAEQARTAALLYYQAAQRQWPPPGRAGVVPPGMLAFLPGDVSFARARYRLAWEYAADTVTGARVIGISVTGDDPKLAEAMAQRAPEGMPFIVSGRRFVVLIASASGR